MDIMAMAKGAGVSESELKGKSLKEQIKIITKAANESAEKLEIENAKTYISNNEKLVPKLKDQLEKPIEIYVKKVAQKKSPTIVSVVGYNSVTKEVVVYFNDKFCGIKDNEIIKTVDEFVNIINTKKSKAKGKTVKK